MTPPKVRLAFASFFRRATIVLIVSGELVLLGLVRGRLQPGMPVADRLALVGFLSLCFVILPAIPIACLVTIAADLIVHLVVRPVVRKWHAPGCDDGRSAFHLAAGESVVASTPARRADSRRGEAGWLVLTDRGLWFFPEGWRVEPWSAGLDTVRSIRSVAAPRLFWGLVQGLPERIAVEPGPTGRPITFAVPDPAEVARWPRLSPSRIAP